MEERIKKMWYIYIMETTPELVSNQVGSWGEEWTGQMNIPGNAKDLLGRLEVVWRWEQIRKKIGKSSTQTEGMDRETQSVMKYSGI